MLAYIITSPPVYNYHSFHTSLLISFSFFLSPPLYSIMLLKHQNVLQPFARLAQIESTETVVTTT